jgi:hypothetical protein
MEIYVEAISDLLKLAPGGGFQKSSSAHAKGSGLQIREDPVHGIYVAGLTQVSLSSG